ncbi:MAG: peptidase MA family metallohydrolase [Candidatus Omnitrophota bacterium]
MKKTFFALLIIFLFLGFAQAQKPGEWKMRKSTHFIVYYNFAPYDFIEQLIGKSEDYYATIADALGFRRFDFWLWEDRAKIYIYDDSKSYLISTGQPQWSIGHAVPAEKVIKSFVGQMSFFETVLPHEMGHIIFREFVGFNNAAVPLWLDEGIASYQEPLRRAVSLKIVEDAAALNKLIGISELHKINPSAFKDMQEVNLFYAESLSIVDYLIKKFGSLKLALFCQGLRDQKDINKALGLAYSFEGIGELDSAWQKDIRNE